MTYRLGLRRRKPSSLMVCMLVALATRVCALDVETARLVDLTHAFDETTVYWPTARRFALQPTAHGSTPDGWWYAANDFCAAEHGGTHIDAPIHFAEHGWTAEQIPLDRLRGPAVVIRVIAAGERDRDRLVDVRDLERDEAAQGRIPDGAAVLLQTGWARYWPDAARYLGTATRGDTAHLRFPGLHPDAARWLVKHRRVRSVGIDTASIDRGRSRDFLSHRVLAGANVVVFENLANLDALPPRGAVVLALPMKIQGGSGGPLRAVAFVP